MKVLPSNPGLDELNRLARYFLTRLRGHPDYEDIVQETWIRSWREYPRLKDRFSAATVVKVCARKEAQAWVRSYRCLQMLRQKDRSPAPIIMFLEEVLEEREGESGAEMEKLSSEAMLTPDPTVALIDRLELPRMVEIALGAISRKDIDYVRMFVMEDQSSTEITAATGRARNTIWRHVRSGLSSARRALSEAGLCD
jgi:DNA-directed RNA polymerase specialized sigma24 family protein